MADGANGRRAGERIGGYTLAERLGGGGFGEVYLGESGDGRRVAVKFLHAAWADDADMRRRFAAEVEQARRVSGFCIAPIVDADLESPRPWIASEYIDGPTLAAAVAADGPRSGARLHRLAVATATALAAIHGAGVVHRGLKPENILLAADGRAPGSPPSTAADPAPPRPSLRAARAAGPACTGWRCPRPPRWPRSTAPGWSTATSSRRTSCWPRTARG